MLTSFFCFCSNKFFGSLRRYVTPTPIIFVVRFWFSKKLGHSDLFLPIFRYSLTVNKCSTLIFANGWIRTADLLSWKPSLCLLSHNHCPICCRFLRWRWIVYCSKKQASGRLVSHSLNNSLINDVRWKIPDRRHKCGVDGIVFALDYLG